MATTYTKAANLIASKAFQVVQAAAADIVFASNKINFNGLGTAVPLGRFLAYKKTAYSVGQKQVSQLLGGAVATTASTVLTMALRRLDTNQVITYQIITPTTGATTASIAQQFLDALTNDLSCIVTGARVGSDLNLTEKDLATGGFVIIPESGATAAYTGGANVPHITPSGTLAEVQVYDPAVTAGTYDRMDFSFDVDNTQSNGSKGSNAVIVTVWVNLSGAGYASFINRIDGTVSGPLGGILTGAALDVASLAQLQATGETYAEVIP